MVLPAILFLSLVAVLSPVASGLLEQGKYVVRLNFSKSDGEAQFEAIPRSAYKGTQIEIRLGCIVQDLSKPAAKFTVDFTVRSSSCDREFTETLSEPDKRRDMLKSYYCRPQFTQSFFDYTHVWAQRSIKPAVVECGTNPSVRPEFTEILNYDWLRIGAVKNQTMDENCRAGLNPTLATEPSGNESSVSSLAHPTLVTPVHAIYLLVFQVENSNVSVKESKLTLFLTQIIFCFTLG